MTEQTQSGHASVVVAGRAWVKAVRWVVFVVVLGFVAYALSKQIVQIDWQNVRFRALPIAAAAVCLLLVPPVQLVSYRTLLGAYAHQPPMRVMAAVAWIPPLGKYVPGKVASLAGAVYLLVQACLGLRVNALEQRVTFAHAVLPEEIDWIRIINLSVGRASIDLLLTRHTYDVGVTVLRREGNLTIIAEK